MSFGSSAWNARHPCRLKNVFMVTEASRDSAVLGVAMTRIKAKVFSACVSFTVSSLRHYTGYGLDPDSSQEKWFISVNAYTRLNDGLEMRMCAAAACKRFRLQFSCIKEKFNKYKNILYCRSSSNVVLLAPTSPITSFPPWWVDPSFDLQPKWEILRLRWAWEHISCILPCKDWQHGTFHCRINMKYFACRHCATLQKSIGGLFIEDYFWSFWF